MMFVPLCVAVFACDEMFVTFLLCVCVFVVFVVLIDSGYCVSCRSLCVDISLCIGVLRVKNCLRYFVLCLRRLMC